ncbi:TGS domain-containing protein [Thermodesulfobacteriota bacterium]
MPANLPPNYFEAEKRFREAKKPEDKISALEEMLTIMPKHKGTDKLRASLRQKISKFKNLSQKKGKTSRKEAAYAIDREGAAQVIIIGPPNSGKSSLVAALTRARPEVAEFPHSTWKPTPGMAPYENIQFQLVDTPPITKGYMDPWMGDLIRQGQILAIIIDLHADPLMQFEEMISVLHGLRAYPAGFPIPENLKKPPFVKEILVLVNKVDDADSEEDYEIFKEFWESKQPCLDISVNTGRNLQRFLEMIYETSGIIRVYTKVPGKKYDLENPFILPIKSTLEDLAGKIHKDFVDTLKFARIWGRTVFDGQMVQRDYVLQEGDVVEIHT